MDEIKKFLSEYELGVEDLTANEVEQIKHQIEVEKNGGVVFDGFDPAEVRWRKLKGTFAPDE